MALADPDLERLVETRIRKVNALGLGVATGLVAGLGLFVGTNWLLLKGGPVVGPHLSLLGQFFIGYRMSFLGSLIGFAWAAVTGFLVAYAGAWIYNRVADLRQRERR
jgi:hypothetical protein